MPKAAIIGGTTWGIALAFLLARKKTTVRLLVRTREEVARLKKSGPGYAGLSFPSNINITCSIHDALEGAEAAIMVVPAQTMRQNIKQIAPYLNKSTTVISGAKGLEIETGKRMTQVISEEIDPETQANIAVLSGPNLAKEIMANLPAATVVAAFDSLVAQKARELFAAPNFGVYTNSDVIGVELGGALKNIIALGAGMIDGFKYGDNAKSAFITRGLTEITALGVAMGASPLTFSGLAGIGDLIVTCSSELSRNHFVGVELTKGRSLKEIVNSMDGVAEGVATTRAAWNLAQQYGLEMPITSKIYQVLYESVPASQVAMELMGSPGRHELIGRKWNLFSLFRHRRRS